MSIETVDANDTLAVLKAAEAWLSDPEHFAQHWYGYDASGRAVTNPKYVVQTCVNGAICLVMGSPTVGDAPDEKIEPLRRALTELGYMSRYGGFSELKVNDGPDGYNRIMAGLRRAIETLEAS
jgi:hypothetical protein